MKQSKYEVILHQVYNDKNYPKERLRIIDSLNNTIKYLNKEIKYFQQQILLKEQILEREKIQLKELHPRRKVEPTGLPHIGPGGERK